MAVDASEKVVTIFSVASTTVPKRERPNPRGVELMRLADSMASNTKNMKSSVLFICFHNSARSQMAEALVNHFCSDDFAAESAGIEAGTLNPYAVRVMAEIGIDISAGSPRKVFEVVKTGKVFGHAISLCDEASEGRCPIIPRHGTRHHWGFPNPASSDGTEEERMERMRNVRDLIRRRIQEWCADECKMTAV